MSFAFFFSLISGQGKENTNIPFFICYFISNIDFSEDDQNAKVSKEKKLEKIVMNLKRKKIFVAILFNVF